ncbi:MAG: hypothetical protein KME64_02625 [Scytonematopsis contorta HA4267-MV1]|jgi:hypothetical protein|nr:hypothetical protein [Scytonematopsis contorta HA4267-MV1]
MKYLIIAFCFTINFLIANPAAAATCRNFHGHKICIIDINRSAKNYYEYRASVSVDGIKQPLQTYNCRRKIKITPDGTISRFEPNDPGDLICSIFKK